MDKSIKVVVTCVILSYATVARSYNGYYNRRFERQHEFHHGFEHHNHGHWHGPDWDFNYHNHHNEYPRNENGYPRNDNGYPMREDGYPMNENGYHSQDFGYPPQEFDSPQREWAENGEKSWNNQNSQNWGDDRWIFPDPGSWSPNGSPPTRQPPAPTTANPTTSSTVMPLAIQLCIRTCQVTSEYNPVCGSNNVTYNNPGRLDCARNCGVDVSLQRSSPCPRPNLLSNNNATPITQTPPTTAESTLPPVNPGTASNPAATDPNNGFTIPPDVLASIFTNPTTDDGDDDSDIDIRTRTKDENSR